MGEGKYFVWLMNVKIKFLLKMWWVNCEIGWEFMYGGDGVWWDDLNGDKIGVFL